MLRKLPWPMNRKTLTGPRPPGFGTLVISKYLAIAAARGFFLNLCPLCQPTFKFLETLWLRQTIALEASLLHMTKHPQNSDWSWSAAEMHKWYLYSTANEATLLGGKLDWKHLHKLVQHLGKNKFRWCGGSTMVWDCMVNLSFSGWKLLLYWIQASSSSTPLLSSEHLFWLVIQSICTERSTLIIIHLTFVNLLPSHGR